MARLGNASPCESFASAARGRRLSLQCRIVALHRNNSISQLTTVAHFSAATASRWYTICKRFQFCQPNFCPARVVRISMFSAISETNQQIQRSSYKFHMGRVACHSKTWRILQSGAFGGRSSTFFNTRQSASGGQPRRLQRSVSGPCEARPAMPLRRQIEPVHAVNDDDDGHEVRGTGRS